MERRPSTDIYDALSVQHQTFVEAYLRGDTPLDALREAGLASGGPADATAAAALLRAPLVRAYVDAMHRTAAERSILTLEAIDQRLTDIAMTDVIDVCEIGQPVIDEDGIEHTPIRLRHPAELTAAQRAAIASLKTIDGGVEIKMVDKLKALELLAKRRGGFVNVSDVNVSGGLTTVFAMCDDNGRGPVSAYSSADEDDSEDPSDSDSESESES